MYQSPWQKKKVFVITKKKEVRVCLKGFWDRFVGEASEFHFTTKERANCFSESFPTSQTIVASLEMSIYASTDVFMTSCRRIFIHPDFFPISLFYFFYFWPNLHQYEKLKRRKMYRKINDMAFYIDGKTFRTIFSVSKWILCYLFFNCLNPQNYLVLRNLLWQTNDHGTCRSSHIQNTINICISFINTHNK